VSDYDKVEAALRDAVRLDRGRRGVIPQVAAVPASSKGIAMRPRAIKDLAQLSDPALFEAVAEGLGFIIKNVTRLYGGAGALADAKASDAN